MTESGRSEALGDEPSAPASDAKGETSVLSLFARQTIERLVLAPHPEGGWYRRTWQSELSWLPVGAPLEAPGAQDSEAAPARPLASLIYFLLPQGDASAWHLVDADEVWLWHGPGAVTLEFGGTGVVPVASQRLRLGVDAEGVPVSQLVVPAGQWQRTLPAEQDVLCSCVVSPGFVWEGFTQA